MIRRGMWLHWLVLVLLMATGTAPAAAQQGYIERAGDLVMRTFPVASLGTTLLLEDWDGTQQFLLGFGATAVVTEGLKWLVVKPRPDQSDNNSFPSGHTSIAFQSATFVHLRYGAAYGVPAYVAAAFVGMSRVQPRKHFVEDVFAGLAIGVAGAALFTEERVEHRPSPALTVGLQASLGTRGSLSIRSVLLGLDP